MSLITSPPMFRPISPSHHILAAVARCPWPVVRAGTGMLHLRRDASPSVLHLVGREGRHQPGLWARGSTVTCLPVLQLAGCPGGPLNHGRADCVSCQSDRQSAMYCLGSLLTNAPAVKRLPLSIYLRESLFLPLSSLHNAANPGGRHRPKARLTHHARASRLARPIFFC